MPVPSRSKTDDALIRKLNEATQHLINDEQGFSRWRQARRPSYAAVDLIKRGRPHRDRVSGFFGGDRGAGFTLCQTGTEVDE